MSIQTVEIALPTGIDSVSVGLAEPISIVEVRQGAGGEPGAAGATGPAGPNTLTTATTTNLTGFISGDGTNISGATAATSTATANTLVLRSAGGGASFAGITLSGVTANSGSYAQIGGATFNVATTSNANLTTTGSGTVTVSGAGGTTISGGPLTISASSATFATGSIATSQPLALTQTWTNAATTYTGLQVNVTDTASAAASLLMDLRVGGVSRFNVSKSGTTTISGSSGVYQSIFSNNTTFSKSANNKVAFWLTPNPSLLGLASDVLIGWGSGTNTNSTFDLSILRDDANTLAQRNGTAQQESRIYGTYTGPGNYRRLALKMSNTGVAQIVAEGGGSGASGNRIEIDGLRIGKGGGNIATNTALGASALNANTSGSNNTAVGSLALERNTTGEINSAIGAFALYSNTTGSSNSAVGLSALGFNTSGSTNTAVGRNAGRVIANGSTGNTVTNNSVYLGNDTKALASGQTNQIVIGYNATGLGSNTAVLGNDNIVTTALKGNVGIGTTSPGAPIDIQSTTPAAWTGLRLVNNSSSGAASSSISLYGSGGISTNLFTITQFSAGSGSVPGHTIINNAYPGGLGRIRFQVSSSDVLTLINGGNVGIGTTSPTAMLDVNSDTVRVRTARTPASAAAAGNAGDICWDADYIYVCTATDTWKRAAISTW
jgi:hypothetical protein